MQPTDDLHSLCEDGLRGLPLPGHITAKELAQSEPRRASRPAFALLEAKHLQVTCFVDDRHTRGDLDTLNRLKAAPAPLPCI